MMKIQNLLYLTCAFLCGGFCFLVVSMWFETSNEYETNGGHDQFNSIDWTVHGNDPIDPLRAEQLQTNIAKTTLSLLEAIASSEIDATIPLLANLYESSNRNPSLMKAVIPLVTLTVVSNSDFESTLAQAVSLKPPLRRSVVEHVFSAWAVESPETALAWWIDSGQDDDVFDGIDNVIISTWAHHDCYDLIETLSELPVVLRSTAEAYAMESLANIDPKEAIAMRSRYADTLFESEIIKQVVKTWAQQDRDAALSWVLEAEMDAKTKSETLTNIFLEFVQEEPRRAFEQARQLENEEIFEGLTATLIVYMSAKDPEVAEMWAKQQYYSIHVWTAVGTGYVKKREWSKAMLVADLIEVEEKNFYWDLVLESWAMNDPEALLEHLDVLPGDFVSKGALEIAKQNRWYRFLDDRNLVYILSLLSDRDRIAWKELNESGSDHYMTIYHDGSGIMKSFTEDEVFTALHLFSSRLKYLP